MLQQTRVETVLRYYEPFLARFPTFEVLAKAKHQDVLKMWEGLGYYRRILHLHRAAQELCKQGGEFQSPRGANACRVGVYTAAAIASIAYGEPVAAVDANVKRVISRLLGINDTPLASAQARIQTEADKLLCTRRPGDFNQAWMDLGSSICLPRMPRCAYCPLKSSCVTGNLTGGQIPVSKPKAQPAVCSVAVGLLVQKDRMLVRRRPEGGLWSGLWEFPSRDVNGNGVARSFDQLAADYSLIVPRKPRRVGLVRHQLTHKSINFHVFEAEIEQAGLRSEKSTRWVTQEAFERLPVSTAHRRIHRLWMAFRSRRAANRP
jgi:A/G-specific adenine glycosylase